MLKKRQVQKMFRKWKLIGTLAHTFFWFVTSCYAADVTLKWDGTAEPDIAGYKIYYKSGSSGHPYNGTEATEGDSPITIAFSELSNPNHPEYTIHDLDDFETYYFVITAYDVDGHESGYSNQACINCSSGSSGSSGCFIATAAYGSPMQPYVRILREFRDKFLLNNLFGKAFVSLYYKYSPPMANFIAEHANLRAIIRVGLLPAVAMSWVALNHGYITVISLLMFCCMGLIRVGFWKDTRTHLKNKIRVQNKARSGYKNITP